MRNDVSGTNPRHLPKNNLNQMVVLPRGVRTLGFSQGRGGQSPRLLFPSHLCQSRFYRERKFRVSSWVCGGCKAGG